MQLRSQITCTYFCQAQKLMVKRCRFVLNKKYSQFSATDKKKLFGRSKLCAKSVKIRDQKTLDAFPNWLMLFISSQHYDDHQQEASNIFTKAIQWFSIISYLYQISIKQTELNTNYLWSWIRAPCYLNLFHVNAIFKLQSISFYKYTEKEH